MLHKDLVPETSHDLILILTLGNAPGPNHDLKHAPRYFISRPLSLIIINYQKSILLLLLFLKCVRPDSVDRAVGLGQVHRERLAHGSTHVSRRMGFQTFVALTILSSSSLLAQLSPIWTAFKIVCSQCHSSQRLKGCSSKVSLFTN